VRLDWLVLAEGLGQDASGRLTAIGLNQNVLIAPTLPLITKRAVIAHFIDEENELSHGDRVTASFTPTSPSGEVLGAQETEATIGRRTHLDLPASMDFPMEFFLNIREYGRHCLGVELALPNGKKLTGEVYLYVMRSLSEDDPPRRDEDA
jgi:hypothetical protein